jgi:hypothetical protein
MAREADSATNATEAAAKAGERNATDIADRMANASKIYGAAMGVTFKAVQDYNTKLAQVFQTNAVANLRLGQTLMQTRSPADFVETMSKSVRERTELIAGQTKELAALGQEVARSPIEAIVKPSYLRPRAAPPAS